MRSLLIAATALLGPVSIVPTVRAQEFGKPVASRTGVIGTYTGTRAGRINTPLSNGDIVDEQTECSLTMEFLRDGTMRYDAGRYYYRKTYMKKTTTGGYLKAVTTTESKPEQRTVRGEMSAWVTQYGNVWRALWSPRVETFGHELKEYLLTNSAGVVRGQSEDPETRPLKVWCDIHLNWRGAGGAGDGLPLSGSITQADAAPSRSWMTVHASWNLTPVKR